MSAMVKLDKLYKEGVMYKPPKEKKCKECKAVRPLTDFKKSYKNKDGRANRCRVCDKEYAARNSVTKVNPAFFEHDKYYSF